jgi:hypothetical protein
MAETENSPSPSTSIPKKPSKGRKFWLTIGVLVVPFVACTTALYLGKLAGEAYVSFLQWTIPIALGVHHAANVAEKVGLAKLGLGEDQDRR